MPTILAELIIPECGQPIYIDGRWEFSCGLGITDKLVAASIDTHGCLGFVHENHHKHMTGQPIIPWAIVETIDIDETSFKISFTCVCK